MLRSPMQAGRRRRAVWRCTLVLAAAPVLTLAGWAYRLPAASAAEQPDTEAESSEARPKEAPSGEPSEELPGEVIVIAIDSIIHPVASEFLRDSLEAADRRGAEAFVIELNTPGGLLQSTREMYSAMLDARTPVVVFVAPAGAQAASAGFFLLMAADIAAMTPGSNTGAAHPVGGQGEEIEGTMGEKVEQDAAASIRSLAARNGRNPELAEKAVTESRSYTAHEALEGGLIDLVAPNLQALLQDVSGRTVKRGEEEIVLKTARAEIRRVEMTPFQRVRSILAHPNIAYLLLSLGGLGLYFELANPGAIFPGVIGLICLILAFYSLSVLPVNYAGLALIGLAALLFVLEIKVQSFGLLTAGGLASLVLGSLMLFKSVDPALRVSVQLIITLSLLTMVTVGFLMTLVYRAHRSRVFTGQEGLVGERGIARSTIDGSGKVGVRGEIWNATADQPIAKGQRVEVVAVDGMTVKVRVIE